jgi:hypothetical protein
MRYTRRPVLVIATLAVAAFGVAGCGGDEERALSKQEFVAKADAICADANRKEAGIVREGLGWHYGPKFSDPELMTRFTAAGRDALRRLRGLEPPEKEREVVRDVLANIEKALGAIDKQIAASRAGKKDAKSANVRAYETAYTDLGAAAGRSGLTQCQGVAF